MERLKKINWKIPVILMFIILIVFFIWMFFKTKTLTIAENIPVKTKDKMALTNDEIFILNEDQLTAYNYNSKEIWTKTIGLKNPKIAATKDYIYLGEGRILLVLNSKGESVKQLELPLDCDSMKVDGEGLFIRSEERQVLIVKDEIQSRISEEKVKMSENALSPDGKEIVFTEIELRKGRILSKVIWTEKGGKVVSKQSFFDEIIEYAEFISEDELILASNHYLYILENGVIKNQIAVNFLKGIDISGNKIYCMDLDDLTVYDKNFKLLDKIPLEKDYKGIVAVKDGMILYHESGYSVYQTGSLKEEISTRPTLRAEVIQDHIYLIHEDAISVIY